MSRFSALATRSRGHRGEREGRGGAWGGDGNPWISRPAQDEIARLG